MTEAHALLQRMRILALEAGNVAANDRTAVRAADVEIGQLRAELDRIAERTRYGTTPILDGSLGGGRDEPVVLGGFGMVLLGDRLDLEPNLIFSDPSLQFGPFGAPALTKEEAAAYTGNLSLGSTVDGIEVTATFRRFASVFDIAAAFEDAFAQAATVPGRTPEQRDSLLGFSIQPFEGPLTSWLVISRGGSEVLADLAFATAPAGEAVFQVGANATQTESVQIAAVLDVSFNRAELGAVQNRMASTIRSLSVTVENLAAAESRIRDADLASGVLELMRSQILVQAGTAMLAQANVGPQTVLALLGT